MKGSLRIATILWGISIASALIPASHAMESLPSNIVNVALPEFGNGVKGGYDYGEANVKPVEVSYEPGKGREIRIVRTPSGLRLSHRNQMGFKVLLGNVDVIYFWIDAPRVTGQWHLTLSLIYPDLYRKVLFSRNMQNRVINYAYVDPGTTLEVQMKSVEQTMKLSKFFSFTVSPVLFSTWPGYFPIPFRNFWE